MCPTHFESDGRMLMRIFSPVFAAYPQRFCPHCSMRTCPLFSSVAQTPSGVVGAAMGAAATGACFGAAGATVGGADGATSSLTLGADDVDATAVEAGGGLAVAATDGCGAAA